MGNLPVGQTGFGEMGDDKINPRKCGGYSSKEHGHGHDFNMKAKVTNPGGKYNGFEDKTASSNGNFSEKDSSIDYLRGRGKEGQVIKEYSGVNELSKNMTENIGLTAYNSKPVDEVYKPATSGNVPKPDPVVYRTIKKTYLKK